jgi:radical SAM-linked protein
VAYTKLGRAAYRSHLDLVRLLPRIFRRLELPMYYSQGFHPKPELSFGPALPLGVASQAEYVDVKLVETPGLDEQAIRARLCGASLEGITFRDARMLGANDAGLAKVIDSAEYAVGLPRTLLAARGLADDAALARHLEQKASEPLSVVRDMKGIKRSVDVSRYLAAVALGGVQQLTDAGVVGELAAFTFRLHVTGQGGARPSEVLEALFGAGELPARLVRTFMGRGSLDPLALEALRTQVHAVEEPCAELALDTSHG